MDLKAYDKKSITDFNGLYKRGMADECPPDHSICNENCSFTKDGEVQSRDGMLASEYSGHPVTQQFLAVTSNGTFLLTCDGTSNIYQNDSPTPIFTYGNLVGFSALNLAGHTYILPISSAGTPANLQVWLGTGTTRDAAGLAPSTPLSVADTGTGKIAPGVYQVAVSFVTDTGFQTPPSPLFSYTCAGSKQAAVTSIPIGPSGTVARQILITRANELELFFIGVSEGGLINDNSTTTTTLNFYDTDLSISADYLNDLYQTIPGAVFSGTLNYYHSRMCVVVDSPVVKISRVQDPESINMVDGLLQVPTEGGENVYGLCQLRDVLYVTAAPGIWLAEDNTLEPTFWPIIAIDGGVGSFPNGIGTLSSTSNALTSLDTFLFADRLGLMKFSGAVDPMPLTWKIDDIWKQINFNAQNVITTLIDVFHQRFFVLAPIDQDLAPGIMLMGDYSKGLDAKNIKWSLWTFPYQVQSLGLYYFRGNLDAIPDYLLRISFQGDNSYIYAITPGQKSDQGAQINYYYTTYLMPEDLGSVNLYRAIRIRANGSGLLALTLNPEDFQNPVQLQSLTVSNTQAQDLTRQCNFMNEKMSLTFGVDPLIGGATDYMKVTRIDIFTKEKFLARPQ